MHVIPVARNGLCWWDEVGFERNNDWRRRVDIVIRLLGLRALFRSGKCIFAAKMRFAEWVLEVISDRVHRICFRKVVEGEMKIRCVVRTLIRWSETVPAVDGHGRPLPDIHCHHLTTMITVFLIKMTVVETL